MSAARWFQDYPNFLSWIYQLTHWIFTRIAPLLAWFGYNRVNHWLRGPEELSKKLIFGCRMCGQCILHSTGMTCPMTCPKDIRNGPCGGVRQNGHCEVIPEMRCVWVDAFERSQKMIIYSDEIRVLQPPLNRQLEGTSAWVNMLTGEDKSVPAGWQNG